MRLQRKEDNELEDHAATRDHQGKLSSLKVHQTVSTGILNVGAAVRFSVTVGGSC